MDGSVWGAGGGLRSGDISLPAVRGAVPLRRRPVHADSLHGMCRNIRTLHNFEPPATEEEVQAAALQYVRKISGYTKPSRANAEAFARAVEAVTAASETLLAELSTIAPPKDREAEAAKARARRARREAAAA
jgi:hypothetical protein